MTISFSFADTVPTFALVKGHVLRLKTGLVVVPYEANETGWLCVVVRGNGNPAYTPDGYNIHVYHQDLLAAERVEIGGPS